MPTPAYISAANFQKGVAAVEAGINISSYRQGWSNEKLNVENKHGSITGFVHNFLAQSTCTISGEVNTATLPAVLGVAFGVAETIANSIDGYGVVGLWFLDDIEINQERGSLATSTANFTRHPDITTV
jgi:hypothetical protein